MRAFLLLPFLCLSSVYAADRVALPMSDAEKAQKLARAAALKAEGTRMEQAADAKFKADQEACYKKFLVSDCLEEASNLYKKTTREANRKTLEGSELERDVKRSEVAAADAKRAAEAPRREKQKQAAEGRKKRADDLARQQKKVQENAEKQAKAAEKRKAREAAREARRQQAAGTNP